MSVSRREFLKLAGVSALFGFPFDKVTQDDRITFVNAIIDGNAMADAMEVYGHRLEGDTIYANIKVDRDAIWRCVKLVDHEGNTWHTQGFGTEWECEQQIGRTVKINETDVTIKWWET